MSGMVLQPTGNSSALQSQGGTVEACVHAGISDIENEVRALLKEAMDRFWKSTMWSIDPAFILAPQNAEEVAKELRHGPLEAFRFSGVLMAAATRLRAVQGA